jgi:RimJ/RimL family protein N-acetyltransferase
MICYQGMKVYLDADLPIDETQKWRNDKRVWKWCRQHTLLSFSEHHNWLSTLGSTPHKMYSVWDLMKKTLVGVCGLTDIDHLNQKAEFSLYIAPEQHQKGYGKHALLSLLRHGFFDHNLNVIWGETYDGNPATKLFEDLGMKLEGTLRERYYRDGRFIDTRIYSITRNDFRVVACRFFGDLGPPVAVPDVSGVVDGEDFATWAKGFLEGYGGKSPFWVEQQAEVECLTEAAKNYSALGGSGSGA